MTSLEIYSLIEPQARIRQGVPYFSAQQYGIPAHDWLFGTFYDWWWSQPGSPSTWTTKWECWQLTGDFIVQAQRANALAPQSPAGETALAVGRWDFLPDSGHNGIVPQGPDNFHSICQAVTDRGLVRVDLQNRFLWTPSPAELSSTRKCDW